MKKLTSFTIVRPALVIAFMTGTSLQADTSLWNGSVSGNWNTTQANWTNTGAGLYTTGDIVQFGDTGGANLTISLNAGAVTPASVSFTDTGAGTNAYTFSTNAINGTGTTLSLNSGFGGSVRLNVANGYTGGTTLGGGNLQVAINGALGTGTINLSGGSLQSAGSGVKTLTNNVVATTSTTTSLASVGGDLTLSGALTGSGTISVNNATAGSSWVSGNLSGFTGTLSHNNINNGNNFFVSGGADLSGAKVVLSGATTSTRRFGANSAGNVAIGELSGTGGVVGAANNLATTYTIGALNTNSSYSGTFINVGSGVASITKVGSGTLSLSGASIHTGTTTVTAGTLLINNAIGSGTGTGAVNVTAGTFGGTGSATGAVNVSSGAFLRGGDGSSATDDLSLSGNLTLNDNSILQLALAASGAHSSLTRTAGTWTFDSNQAFSFLDLGATAGTYNNLISGLVGTEAGISTIGTWTIQNAGWLGSFSYDGTGGVDLTLTAVPEPSTYALLGLGLATLIWMRRRSGNAEKGKS